MSYILNNNVFDIFQYSNQIKSHKNSEISINAGYIVVKYDKIHNKTSSGFRNSFKTIPNKWYRIVVEAELKIGDKAFIYCETENYVRLLPRDFLFYKDQLTKYDLYFKALTETTLIGILFFENNKDYIINITQFQIKYIATNENSLLKNTQNILPSAIPNTIDLTKYRSSNCDIFESIYNNTVNYHQTFWVGLLEKKLYFPIAYLINKDDNFTKKIKLFLPNIKIDYEKCLKNINNESNIIETDNPLPESIRPYSKIFLKNYTNKLIIEIRPDGFILIYKKDYSSFYPIFHIYNEILEYLIQ